MNIIKPIKFTKMHGLGNDFMVLDGIHQSCDITPEFIRMYSNRYTGIGFDQCLVVEKSTKEGIDFFYRIFNADGHEVGQCGNGARCLARFIKYYGLSDKKHLKVATKTAVMELMINVDDSVTVNMGKPNLLPKDIPINSASTQNDYAIPLSSGAVKVHVLSIGNPHAVIDVPDVATAPVEDIGSQISIHTLFPEQCNVGFMERVSANHLKLRVFERGCGETQACGSGAVAAAAAGRLFYNMEEEIRVSLLGGDLSISWPQLNESIYMTGPATFVYEGHLLI